MFLGDPPPNSAKYKSSRSFPSGRSISSGPSTHTNSRLELTSCQRRRTWSAFYAKTVSSSLETTHSLAKYRHNAALFIRRSQFRQNHRPRISGASSQPIQSIFLPSNMDHDCARCRVLERDEDQKQEIARHCLNHLHHILFDRGRAGR